MIASVESMSVPSALPFVYLVTIATSGNGTISPISDNIPSISTVFVRPQKRVASSVESTILSSEICYCHVDAVVRAVLEPREKGRVQRLFPYQCTCRIYISNKWQVYEEKPISCGSQWQQSAQRHSASSATAIAAPRSNLRLIIA